MTATTYKNYAIYVPFVGLEQMRILDEIEVSFKRRGSDSDINATITWDRNFVATGTLANFEKRVLTLINEFINVLENPELKDKTYLVCSFLNKDIYFRKDTQISIHISKE